MAGQLKFSFLKSSAEVASSAPRERALTTMPRMAPAAVRIPDERHQPMPLVFPAGAPQLFVHEGARQLLERKLAFAASAAAVLSITDNRHSMVRHARQDGVLRVRAHHMFLDAPTEVQDALVRYVVSEDRQASNLIGRYINANLHRIRSTLTGHRTLRTRGRYHDLLPIFDKLNDTYFGATVDALITWGRGLAREPGHGPRKSVRLGTYNPAERLITIHPLLDRSWVPRYFAAFVVYHEMLHYLIPAARTVTSGRAILHSRAFRERERAFRQYERALSWERAHIGRLLRG